MQKEDLNNLINISQNGNIKLDVTSILTVPHSKPILDLTQQFRVDMKQKEGEDWSLKEAATQLISPLQQPLIETRCWEEVESL